MRRGAGIGRYMVSYLVVEKKTTKFSTLTNSSRVG